MIWNDKALADDARWPTPEHMREAYRRFIKTELEDVHTPSPLSSPKSIARSRPLRRPKGTQCRDSGIHHETS